MRSFSFVCEIFVTVVLLFLIPTIFYSCQQELILENYVQYQVTYFTDCVRNVGYVDENMYCSFQKKLSQTNHIYEVDIAVYERYRNSGNYMGYVLGTYTDEVLTRILDERKRYEMHQGDFIAVKVKRTDATIIEKVLDILGVSNVKNSALPIQYGGMIRDECF